MKPVHCFCLLALLLLHYIVGYSQAGTWTWMKGDSIANSPGSFGIEGVPSPTNAPPAKYACGYWIDTTGNFWIYGGGDIFFGTNDLWKFNPQTLIWTWMNGDNYNIAWIPEKINAGRGIYDSENTPGALIYGIFTWVTLNNHLWLFGGSNSSTSTNVDLWQYDLAINEWAWMGTFGPANYGTKGIGDSTSMPGGRCEGNCAWTDNNGNLWLFGGFDSLSYAYNDMWMYNVNTGIWTWMSGSSNPNDAGISGTIGVPSVNIYPSARSTNLFWKDEQGNFWLAGGTQYSSSDEIMFQDIWKFNPQTLEWTWVKGPNGVDTATLGDNCKADTLNEDGPRYENRTVWKLSDDLIITYGGFANWNILTEPNDLWTYKVSLNEWIKINLWPNGGSYGIQGIAAPANYPPTRFGSVGFKDKDNNFWMFSGASDGFYNDLWKYIPDTACINATITGVQQLGEEEQVLLYPNPCSMANVQLTVGSKFIGSRLAVFDMQGRLFFYSAISNQKSEIDISGLAAGVYLVRVSSANGGVVRKLVKL